MFRKSKQPENIFREHESVFYPPSEFSGYEIVNEDRESLMSVCELLSNGLADMSEICFDNKYEFVDSLIEAGFITGDFEQQYSLTEMAAELNRLIKTLGYDISLSVEDVLARDDEEARSLRRDFEYMTSHDLNACARLIGEQGYELFQVFLDCGGLTMAILPKDKMGELKNYLE